MKAEGCVGKDDITALVRCSSEKLRSMLIYIAVVFGAFMLLSIISGSFKRNFSYCAVAFLWCAAVYLYVFILKPRLAWRSFRRRFGEDALITYDLGTEKLGVSVRSRLGQFGREKQYAELFRAYETQEHFFFYFKRSEIFVMKKSSITEGSAEELSALLARCMGVKFVRKVKQDDKI